MQAPGFVRTLQHLLVAATLALAACGGGNSGIGGVSGSSSGGDSSVLGGTFSGQTGTSQRVSEGDVTDTVFGAVDGAGNGFLADMSAASAGNQAVFRLSPASQPSAGTVSGSYYAYYTGGSNNTIIAGGTLSGTYTASSASLTFGPVGGGTSNGPSDTAALVLDSPALSQASFATMAGTYTATVGSGSSPAITTSTNQRQQRLRLHQHQRRAGRQPGRVRHQRQRHLPQHHRHHRQQHHPVGTGAVPAQGFGLAARQEPAGAERAGPAAGDGRQREQQQRPQERLRAAGGAITIRGALPGRAASGPNQAGISPAAAAGR
jgi:hypothetical protein